MNAILTEYDEEQVLKNLSQEFYEDGVADLLYYIYTLISQY